MKVTKEVILVKEGSVALACPDPEEQSLRNVEVGAMINLKSILIPLFKENEHLLIS